MNGCNHKELSRMPTYSAYGLIIKSDIDSDIELAEFTNIAHAPSIPPDVVIHLGTVEHIPAGEDMFRMVDRQTGYIVVQGTAVFRVTDGREIVIDPVSDPPESLNVRKIAPFLTGACIGMILYQRGLFTLHASAVWMGTGAVAFIGHKGQGKSVMAASLHERGYPILTDDILAVESDHFVRPASPQVKLWADALIGLGRDPDPLPYVHPMSDKRYFKIESPLESDARYQLCHVFVLGEGDTPHIVPLSPIEAFTEIMRHSYAARWLSRAAPDGAHFVRAGQFVKTVPVSRLIRAKDYAAIPAVIETLERALNIR
jgi:hypothetical protein